MYSFPTRKLAPPSHRGLLCMGIIMESNELKLLFEKSKHYSHDVKSTSMSLTLSSFPDTGVCLRPGFIYGWRRAGSTNVPLQLFGVPMTIASRKLGALSTIVSNVPFVGSEMSAAVPVEAVAKSAVLGAIGSVEKQILDTTEMLKLADSFHHTIE